MHPDIKKLNRKDPPPKGCRHPAYDVSGRDNNWTVAYLNNGNWNMQVQTFKSERQAFQFILDKLYYGDK